MKEIQYKLLQEIKSPLYNFSVGTTKSMREWEEIFRTTYHYPYNEDQHVCIDILRKPDWFSPVPDRLEEILQEIIPEHSVWGFIDVVTLRDKSKQVATRYHKEESNRELEEICREIENKSMNGAATFPEIIAIVKSHIR